MMTSRPAGNRPWFARVRYGRRCDLRPVSRAGWLVTFAYALAAAGISLLLLGRGEPAMSDWLVWGVLLAAMTFAFLLIAWRNSATIVRGEDGRAGRTDDRRRTVVIALLTAAAIIGLSLLGVDI